MSYNGNYSSADNARNQQISAQNIQRFSDELINGGINAIKRNPIPSGLYVVGVLVCLFFR
jgi:hypothetical protein